MKLNSSCPHPCEASMHFFVHWMWGFPDNGCKADQRHVTLQHEAGGGRSWASACCSSEQRAWPLQRSSLQGGICMLAVPNKG